MQSHHFIVNSVQFSLVAQSCPTLCDPMNRSTPGLPVHHQLPQFTQTHVHRVGNAIQPSHPLSSPFPPAPRSKAKGGDGNPAVLFQILKDDAVKVLHSIFQQIWKTQQWPQDWKRSVFIPILKKGNAKECSNYQTIALISRASKVMLKILQARFQQYMNQELPDVQAGFRKGRGTREQIVTSAGSLNKQESSRKTSTSALLTTLKPLTVWITTNCGKFLKRWGYHHLTFLLRKLYSGQEAIVRTGHRTTDWFKTEKRI